MTLPAQRARAKALALALPALQCLRMAFFLLMSLFFALDAYPQLSPNSQLITRSVSGQFIVSSTDQYSWLLHQPGLAANTNFIRLDPALMAVAAERFKQILWQQLGLKPDSPWRGTIHLFLRPAHSPDDDVTITTSFALGTWRYDVSLPDVLSRTRYIRALSAVLLLEIANRDNNASGRSAEVPSWLIDGLSQQVLNEDTAKLILTLPNGSVNGLSLSSLNAKEKGLDALAWARATLQNYAPLSFDQMSWPSDEQVNGDDGGAYLASAQLFVHELSTLPHGASKLSNMLGRLPGCENWQTAFFSVFYSDFSRPIAVEKWWSLQCVNFLARDASSRWTAADSNERLAGILLVPVEIRNSSNSLPAYVDITIQSAIRDLLPRQRDDALRETLHELELVQFRLTPPFTGLATEYRTVIMEFLGDRRSAHGLVINKYAIFSRRATVRDTIKRLDALDRSRGEWVARSNFDYVHRSLRAGTP